MEKNNKILNMCYIFLFLIIVSLCIYAFTSRSSKKTLSLKNESKENKIIYLTFDDGPSYNVTDNILDVLKEYNIKGTFFVVGKEIKNKENILTRIYKEGHGIGLHTYSHNYKKIYSNEDIFLNEMLDTQKYVKDITGFSSKIIRFPGGSCNHLTKKFLDKLHSKNLRVYDWNVDTKDGLHPNLSPESLLKNSKKYIPGSRNLIILMHCNSNNKNTVKALPKIIDYYKNKGYKFKKIDSSVPDYYYKLKK